MRKYWITLFLILVTAGTALAATLDSRTEKTAPADPDILYMLQSPYGSGDDRKVTYDSFQSQIDHVGTIDTGVWYGSSISDGYIDDNITVSSSGTVDIDALSGSTLGNLLVGNGSDFDSVAMSGDVTITSAGVTKLGVGSDSTGDTLYHDGTDWVSLNPGSNGQVLKMGASIPAWGTDSTGGGGGSGSLLEVKNNSSTLHTNAVMLDFTGGNLATVSGQNITVTQDTTADYTWTGTHTHAGNSLYQDARALKFGTGDDARFTWQTTGNDNLQLGLDVNNVASAGYFVLLEEADINDADRSPLTISTDPVFRTYSSDADQAGDYIQMYHDRTNGRLQAGGGSLRISVDETDQHIGFSRGMAKANSAITVQKDAAKAGGHLNIRSSGMIEGTGSAESQLYQNGDNLDIINDTGDLYYKLDGNDIVYGTTSNALIARLNFNATLAQILFAIFDDGGNQFIISNGTNASKDHDHALQTDPTLYVHSDTDPDSANDEWISLSHDKTNGQIGLGSGQLVIPSAITVTGSTSFNGINYTWPASQSASQVLQTNGSGTLSWVAQSGGSFDATSDQSITGSWTFSTIDLSSAVTGDVTFVAGVSHIGSLANVPYDNTNNSPTVDNMLEYTDYVGSAGYHTGCTISDSGSGQIDIAECEGLIRPTTSTTDDLISFKVVASTNFAITDDSAEYLYVDYNSGTPQFVANASYLVEATDMVLIGGAVDEGGDIITEWNEGVRLDESIAKAGRFLRRIHTLIRDVRVGGLAFTDGGSSNTLELSAGSLWRGRTEYTITAKDTDAADTFREYYRDGGGGWTQDATETTWDNYYWDDGTGTLNDLGANRWGVHWLYITADDAIHLVYGREQHSSSTDAETQAVPSSLPDILTANGVLAARLIFQRNDTTADSFASSFDMTFNSAGAGDITDVGDCTEGACLDGTSAGGTYVRLYDGDSNYTEINNGDANQSADLKWVLPDANGTAGQVLEIASVATNTLTLEWDDDTTGGGGGSTKFLHTFRPENAKLNLDSAHTAQIDGGSGAWKLRYDADTIETASWMTSLDTYSGGGFTGTIHYTMSSGTSNEVEWQIYMDCLTPNVDNSSLDTNTWGTADVLVDTVSADDGRVFSISDSSLNEDSCALGDIMRVKVDTDADDGGGNDDATGDRELRGLTIEEN